MSTDVQKAQLVELITQATRQGELTWERFLDTYRTEWRARPVVLSFLRDEPPSLAVLADSASTSLNEAVITVSGRDADMRQALIGLENLVCEQLRPVEEAANTRLAVSRATAYQAQQEREVAELAALLD